ncbi:hypothetical protein HAX54_014939 [Datura stramonium]|uniref:Uncharacterized protein n=1 Tax=Datura stramonium TaxID=4076 RepID=A0ABS8TPU4_DATST|nr:hypothetical protein [Datura stramonium]
MQEDAVRSSPGNFEAGINQSAPDSPNPGWYHFVEHLYDNSKTTQEKPPRPPPPPRYERPQRRFELGLKSRLISAFLWIMWAAGLVMKSNEEEDDKERVEKEDPLVNS